MTLTYPFRRHFQQKGTSYTCTWSRRLSNGPPERHPASAHERPQEAHGVAAELSCRGRGRGGGCSRAPIGAVPCSRGSTRPPCHGLRGEVVRCGLFKVMDPDATLRDQVMPVTAFNA